MPLLLRLLHGVGATPPRPFTRYFKAWGRHLVPLCPRPRLSVAAAPLKLRLLCGTRCRLSAVALWPSMPLPLRPLHGAWRRVFTAACRCRCRCGRRCRGCPVALVSPYAAAVWHLMPLLLTLRMFHGTRCRFLRVAIRCFMVLPLGEAALRHSVPLFSRGVGIRCHRR